MQKMSTLENGIQCGWISEKEVMNKPVQASEHAHTSQN